MQQLNNMKTRTTSLFLLLAFLGSLHLAQAQPTITNQPASRINNIGDNAQFSVVAGGSGTLSYQWQFANVAIDGATTNTLNVLVTNSNQAGNYKVTVTDSVGSTDSSDATLSIPFGDRSKLAQWNFNSDPPDTSTATGSLNPSFGSGTYGQLGSITVDFTGGDPSDAAATDNTCWRAGTWGANTTANKARGIQLNVSTLNYKDLVVTWEQKNKAGCSEYWRLQYTTNGTDWTDWTVHTMTLAQTWVFQSSDLTGLSEVNNNPQFAIRLLAEHALSATGSGADKFVATGGGTYSGSDQVTLDMFTFFATPYTPDEVQPVIATQPQSQTNYIGADATFTVVATGGNLQYQWRFNGTDITDATGSSLTVTSIQLTNQGSFSVFIHNGAGSVTSDDATLTVWEVPLPGDRYWSGNGVTVGFNGTWDTTSPRWGTNAAGPFGLPWANANNDSAFFNSPGGTVTLGEAITVSNLVGGATYTFLGTNVLTFATNSGVVCPGTITFNCPLQADTLTKTGAGRLHLGSTANSVNKFVVTGGIVSLQGINTLGAAPAELVPDRLTLDGAGLGFEGVAPSVSATRGITLGAGGGEMAVKSGNITCNIYASITGPGGIGFPTYSGFHSTGIYGSNERFIFNSPSNSYQGATTLTCCELRLGADEVLPDTTTITLNGSSAGTAQGRVNLAGHHETVGSVIANGSGAAIFDTVGGGTLTVTTNYDIRTTRTGGGTNGLYVVLGGAASLTKTTPGDAELGAANTYTGDTFLEAGNLILTSPGCFGNGTGTLHLDGGNVVLNNTRTEDTILMNPVVMTNAVEVTLQSSVSATGEVVFLSGGTWDVEQGTLYLFNASTNAGSSFTLALTNAAQFGATVSISGGASSLASLNPAGTDQVFDGAISDSGAFRRSTLSGPGGRTIFNGANSYSGGTVITAGILLVNSGTGSGAVTVGAPSGVLGGSGSIGGAVTITSGGSIAAGSSVGLLTLQGGLDMSGGGANIWELGVLKDNNDGVAGTDFDQLVLTGGELVLGGSSSVVLQFAEGIAPNSTIPFWQSAHSWTIVSLAGGQNTANVAFASVANGSYNAGNFATSVDGGNIVLSFTPNAPSEPHVTANPQSRTNIVGTTATFTVVATGSDPLSYKWYRNGAPPTQVPGQTNATYMLLNVQPSQAGDYFAVVINGLGSTTSQAASLTVVPRPNMQPPAGDGLGGVVLTWPTIPETSYQVQYNTNLATSGWYPVTNIVAAGWTISITERPPAGGNQRFYRLLIQ